MFGFLRVPRQGLACSEKSLYQSHFCAVCHALDGETGKLSSLLTNYDITFWVLLGAALQPGQIHRRRCTAVPWRQVPVMELNPSTRKALTAVTHYLVASKLEDDALDGERRLLGWALRAVHQPSRKARQTLQDLGLETEGLDGLFAAQSAVEKRAGLDMQAYSRPTREMLAQVFEYLGTLSCRPEFGALLHRVGWHLGGFLYILDAITDFPSDTKRGRFNAVEQVYGSVWSRARLREVLLEEFRGLESALLQLPIDDSRGALCENLLQQLQGRICKATSCQASPAKSRRDKRGFVTIQCDCCGADVCCAACSSGCDASCCHAGGQCAECGTALTTSHSCCECCTCCPPCGRSEPKEKPKEGITFEEEESESRQKWVERRDKGEETEPPPPDPG